MHNRGRQVATEGKKRQHVPWNANPIQSGGSLSHFTASTTNISLKGSPGQPQSQIYCTDSWNSVCMRSAYGDLKNTGCPKFWGRFFWGPRTRRLKQHTKKPWYKSMWHVVRDTEELRAIVTMGIRLLEAHVCSRSITLWGLACLESEDQKSQLTTLDLKK